MKPLPHSEHLENDVLTCLLSIGTSYEHHDSQLTTNSFYSSKNQEIYKAIEKSFKEVGYCDLLSVQQRYSGEDINIVELMNFDVYISKDVLDGKIRELNNMYAKRQMIYLAQSIEREAYNDDSMSSDILTRIQHYVNNNVTVDYIGKVEDGKTTLSRLFDNWCDIAELPIEERKRATGVSTGYANIDHFIGGYKGGAYMILAASPSMGKTTLAMNMVINAMKEGKHVVFVSAEMTKEAIVSKYFDMEYGFSMEWALSKGKEDMNKATSVIEQQKFLDHCHILDKGDMKIGTIRGVVKNQKKMGKCDLVIVDYLGLLNPDDQRANRVNQVSQLSAGINRIAKDFDIPVLCLSQLNRDSQKEGRGGTQRRPVLRDLRDSGAIEQDADVVMMLYSEQYQKDDETRDVEVLVRKNRMGALGGANLIFTPKASKFEENTNTPFVDESDDKRVQTIDLPDL